jgi:hypothetical protein
LQSLALGDVLRDPWKFLNSFPTLKYNQVSCVSGSQILKIKPITNRLLFLNSLLAIYHDIKKESRLISPTTTRILKSMRVISRSTWTALIFW